MATQRIQLTGNTLTRRADTDYDQAYKNCYPEMVDQQNLHVVKRPGLKASLDTTEVAEGRAIYEWEGNIYSVVGTKIFKGISHIGTINTSTGKVYFKDTGGGTPKLFLHDGQDVWYIETDDSVTQLVNGLSIWQSTYDYSVGDQIVPTTDNGYYYEATADTGNSGASEPTWPTVIGNTVVDGNITWECKGLAGSGIPAALAAGWAFLDQYLFLMGTDGTIWNSNVGVHLRWDKADFISAEANPDGGVFITNFYNYVIAFGETSIEMFYDAANTSGSPLSKVSEAVNHIGCPAADSVVKAGNTILFVGTDEGGGRSIYKFEGLTPKPVSNKPIERLLNAETDISDAYAFYVRVNGHFMYVLTLPTTGKTLVYDTVDNAFHEWSSWDGAAESYFTGMDHTHYNGVSYILDEDNGEIYELDVDTYQDDSNIIKVQGTTDLWDGGAYQEKFMNRLEVIGDQPASTANLSISWTDDDYNNFNTARDVDLSDRPMLTRLGSFQRRAFRYTFEANAPMRLEGFEVDVDLGMYGV